MDIVGLQRFRNNEKHLIIKVNQGAHNGYFSFPHPSIIIILYILFVGANTYFYILFSI